MLSRQAIILGAYSSGACTHTHTHTMVQEHQENLSSREELWASHLDLRLGLSSPLPLCPPSHIPFPWEADSLAKGPRSCLSLPGEWAPPQDKRESPRVSPRDRPVFSVRVISSPASFWITFLGATDIHFFLIRPFCFPEGLGKLPK